MAVYELPPALGELPRDHPQVRAWAAAHPLVVKGDKWVMPYVTRCCGGVITIEHSGNPQLKYDVHVTHLNDCPKRGGSE